MHAFPPPQCHCQCLSLFRICHFALIMMPVVIKNQVKCPRGAGFLRQWCLNSFLTSNFCLPALSTIFHSKNSPKVNYVFNNVTPPCFKQQPQQQQQQQTFFFFFFYFFFFLNNTVLLLYNNTALSVDGFHLKQCTSRKYTIMTVEPSEQ